MIPYADFLYFGIALYVVVPALAIALAGRSLHPWILIAGAFMLLVQYGPPQPLWLATTLPRALRFLVGYALLQWLLAVGFLLLRRGRKSRAAFWSALAFGLLPLLASRLAPRGLPPCEEAFGFIGLSYLTFRSLDVVIGIQDGLVHSLPAARFFAFLLFFPTISSGPIDRFRRFSQDWERNRTRAEFLVDLDTAVHRVFTGFFYKFILAALLKEHWLDPSLKAHGFLPVLSTMYAYSLYLFFDFAGYSAFAVGFSHLFGIRTPENFSKPFLARNIREFWNRWHISLSWWFRDHVYSRFVFAAVKGRWFRNPHTASAAGLLLTMGLMGLWHGLEWHYIAYGLYHGGLLVGFEFWGRWKKRTKRAGTGGRLGEAAAIFATFNLVCFGLLIFSGRLFR